MKHARCGNQLHEVKYITFRYWYCRACKDEVPPAEYLVEIDDLPGLGWSNMMHDGDRCWTFGDHEYSIVVTDQDAIEIHKLMAKGMDFGDALIQHIFPGST